LTARAVQHCAAMLQMGRRSNGHASVGALRLLPMPKTQPFVAIVDDETPIRRALVRLLRSAGQDAIGFASGAELLATLPEHEPSCVVLDIHMPGISGFDVRQQLAQGWPHLPVIFVTGHHSAETEAQARASGPVQYLLKPLDGELLLDAIQCVSGRAAGDAGLRA
jgi:FixJ family two-component response regulator